VVEELEEQIELEPAAETESVAVAASANSCSHSWLTQKRIPGSEQGRRRARSARRGRSRTWGS